MDAAESVLVEYDLAPRGRRPSPRSRAGRSRAVPGAREQRGIEYTVATDPGALEDAEVVIRARFVNQRLAPTPMETNGALAIPDPDTGGLTVWLPVQSPFASRTTVARVLGLEESKVRVIAPKVGGGFGAKIPTYAEQVAVCALALRLGATDPVRGDADGEHVGHDPREGPGAGRRARRAPRREDHRSAGPDHGRRRRVSRRGRDPSAAHGTHGLRAVHDPADPLHRRSRHDQHDADRGLSGRRPSGGDGAPRARA